MFITALFTIARTWKQPGCPSADKWMSKLWYIYTRGYCSAIKKNAFESVLMRWMKLELIIQSEVSQKEKHQYSILTHIYMEFRKMLTMTLYVRHQKRHRCKEQIFGLWEKTRVGWFERIALKHVYYHMWNRLLAQVWCMKMHSKPVHWDPEGWDGEGSGTWEAGSGCRTHVHPWLIHVNVWQKPPQYCKITNPQLK